MKPRTLSRRRTVALISDLESADFTAKLRFATPDELRHANVNRAAGLIVKPGEPVPDHQTWDWLPDSARRSGTGLVFVYADEAGCTVPIMAVAPPFPIVESGESSDFKPLMDIVERSVRVLMVDLHAGKARIGVARDEQLMMSRTVSRYVRGRHRAGGQSANRFKRNREQWQHKFNVKLADAVRELCSDARPRAEWVAIAGDRNAAQLWMKQTDVVARTGLKLLRRTFDSRAIDQSALSRLAREVWSSRIYEPPKSDIA